MRGIGTMHSRALTGLLVGAMVVSLAGTVAAESLRAGLVPEGRAPDLILGYTGEDNIVIGTDYGHADTASEIEALQKLKADGKVSVRVTGKILDDNARALYGLN